MNLPNKLTTSRFFITIVFVVVMLWDSLPYNTSWAALLFFIGGMTDILDGYLARKHGLQTDFGALMDLLFIVILSTLLAGLAMPLGATIACFEKIENKWIEEEFRHGIMAFGGGTLLSAVALVLVPEGIANLNPLTACICFIVGGLIFMLLDIYLKKINTPASQLAAMLSDFIPESIALGAAFAMGNSSAFLLTALIALQNLPEGFSAYRELNSTSAYKPKKIIIMFSLMAILGPISGISGYLWLSEYPEAISVVMLFASGGILYSIFQDLAPQVKLEKHWAPPMGAVLGFVLGMFGLMITT